MTLSGPAAFLGALARRLGEAEIPWMLTGPMAPSFYGEPRATNDLDVVLDPDEAQLGRFLSSLTGTFYVGAEEAREAFRTRGIFNVIDSSSGWKADLILLKERAFDDGLGDRGERRLQRGWQDGPRVAEHGHGRRCGLADGRSRRDLVRAVAAGRDDGLGDRRAEIR